MTIPPLLALAEGRKIRLRKPAADRPKEIVLHIAVAHLLREHAREDWRWAHYPAGEWRDAKTAAKLGAMGMKAGWPDFLLFSPDGRLHALELKRRGEALSEVQTAFAKWCWNGMIPYGIARSAAEAFGILGTWGVLRPISAAGAPA